MSKRAQRPDVEPGDEVYVRHPQHGPMAVKVIAHGKDGMTGRCDRGRSHRLPWDSYLGHKARMTQRMRIVDQGADGALLEDDKGRRRFVTGALPDPAVVPAPAAEPKRDDPLLGGLDRLHKSMINEATMNPDTRILFLKAGPIAQRAGLALKDVTDKAGHQTKRWTRSGPAEPANDKSPAPMKHGDVVPFRHGDVQGEGKIVASGADGVTLQDHTGREHQVRHEHLVHPTAGDASNSNDGDKGAAGSEQGDAKPAAGGGDGGGQVPPDQFKAADFYAKHNDANASVDSVLKGFPPDTAGKIADTLKRLDGVEETYKAHMKDGEYTPERQALHDKIIRHILSPEKIEAAMPPEGEAPTFTILGGRGGSGKSWFNGKVFDPNKAIVLDADEIKHMLPEYDGWNAFQVHEESGHLFDRLTDMAEGMGLNLVHDATMKTAKKAVALVQRFKDSGYRVEAHYMHLPRQEAAKRAVGRFLGPTGRFVPPEVVLSNTGNEAAFDAVKDLCDAWSFRDNNVAKGEEPKLISENGDEADQRRAGEDGQHGLPARNGGQSGKDSGLHPGADGQAEGLNKALQVLADGKARVMFIRGR